MADAGNLESVLLERLSPKHDVTDFHCTDTDLDDFLVEDALNCQHDFLAATTALLVANSEQLMGYFSLAADAITLNPEEKEAEGITRQFRSFPALKIARLAIDKRFQGQGWGKGAVLFCIGLARRLNDLTRYDGVGCRFLTVDAYPTAVDFYKKFRFVENEERRRDVQLVSVLVFYPRVI